MKMDTYHCFGSRWFCLQMQDAFDGQARILGELSRTVKDEKFRQVLPLAHAISDTAQAISLLRQDYYLNEAHVLMRLLVERAINLCFLLASEANESAPVAVGQEGRSFHSVNSAEELIEAAKEFQFSETYDSEALIKKLAFISAQTKIPEGFLRLAVASHYPQASAAMSGSVFGAICHLKPSAKEDMENYFQQEFTTLLFSGALLLHEAISLIGQRHQVPTLLQQSTEIEEKAVALMNRIKEPVESSIQDSHGCWQQLKDLEHFAGRKLKEQLGYFEAGFSLCAEAGAEVPTLAHSQRGSLRLKFSALFLKRMLNDLRSVWIMLIRGYTSQSASVAASLFENSLAIQCIVGDDGRALRLSRDPSGELPWAVAEMCRMIINDEKANGNLGSKGAGDWRVLYSHYVWLCGIKHPTLGQTIHDAGATSDGKGSYAIMALPDARQENLDIKKLVCLIALSSTLAAIGSFAKGAGVDLCTERGKHFAAKIERIRTLLSEKLTSNPALNIPFTVQTSSWARKQAGKAMKTKCQSPQTNEKPKGQ